MVAEAIKKIEKVMEFWIFSTPDWMQPNWFWAAYFVVIDKFMDER